MRTLSRRDALKGLAGTGTVAIAGCAGSGSSGDGSSGGGSSGMETMGSGASGGSGSGDFQFRLGTAGEGTITGNAGLAMQRITQDSNKVQLSTVGTSGGTGALRQLTTGSINSTLAAVFSMSYAKAGTGPFSEQPPANDDLPYQGFRPTAFSEYFAAVNGSGIQTTTDLLNSDGGIWLLEASWGPRALLNNILKEWGHYEELSERAVDVDSSGLAGAIEEGRIEAFIGVTAAYRSLASYMQQIDARNNVHYVKMDKDLQKAIEKTDGTDLEEIDPQWQQAFGVDGPVNSYAVPYNIWLSRDVPKDPAYTLAELVHNHGQTMVDTAPTNLNTNKIDQFGSLSSKFPVHPGIAAYLKEQNAWDDSWTVGGQ